jgi:hypothetical protein
MLAKDRMYSHCVNGGWRILFVCEEVGWLGKIGGEKGKLIK